VLPSDWLMLAADTLLSTDIEALLIRRLREGDIDGLLSFGPA
jgi:hypothetical protein